MYTVKETFYTIQGEGVQSGRPAVFCRFAGCNLWTGRERDRATAVCTFCDTDFVGVGPDGGRFATAEPLIGFQQMLCDAVGRSLGFFDFGGIDGTHCGGKRRGAGILLHATPCVNVRGVQLPLARRTDSF